MANTTATFSGELANSLLTTVTWTAYYATTVDTWSTKTQIATGTFTVNSALTRYSAQVALGANAGNGVAIELSVGGQTSGTWKIGQFQLEAGSVATAFERRPIGAELTLCQRYYEIGNAYYDGYAAAGSNPVGGSNIKFMVAKRVVPTLTYGTFSNVQNAMAGAARAIYVDSFERYMLSVAAGISTGREPWKASAEL
ncbi:MAG: hypothetical protein JNK06_18565 [Candidatus Accumulibacter phosphatis]|uniref:hypothetical protein n=1 Tax=Candidatus Accumulibacter phosphatis TaxID=327160 RepID=UPI001A43EFA8|nr:hypothetical protein [Candidatus Accumulibacter phosphatis]